MPVVPVSCAASSPRSVLSFLFFLVCVFHLVLLPVFVFFDQLLLSFSVHMNLICPPVCPSVTSPVSQQFWFALA